MMIFSHVLPPWLARPLIVLLLVEARSDLLGLSTPSRGATLAARSLQLFEAARSNTSGVIPPRCQVLGVIGRLKTIFRKALPSRPGQVEGGTVGSVMHDRKAGAGMNTLGTTRSACFSGEAAAGQDSDVSGPPNAAAGN